MWTGASRNSWPGHSADTSPHLLGTLPPPAAFQAEAGSVYVGAPSHVPLRAPRAQVRAQIKEETSQVILQLYCNTDTKNMKTRQKRTTKAHNKSRKGKEESFILHAILDGQVEAA